MVHSGIYCLKNSPALATETIFQGPTLKKNHFLTINVLRLSHKDKIWRHALEHTSEKPFPCNQCLKSFSQGQHLTTHLRTHSIEKLFPCNQCTKAFSNGSNLKEHLKIYSDEKPFPCNQCNKAFSNWGYLKKHFKKPSGEKTISLQSMS